MVSLDPHALAAELREAERNGTPVALFTDRFPQFGWDDARAVAQARDQLRVGDGEQPTGYKLGWTSAAMREALGIARPNWGRLWDAHAVDADTDLSKLRHAKIEPELVYVAGTSLDGLSTVGEITAGAAGWRLGLELVDPRFPDFNFDWLDNTADSSSAGGYVLGELATLADPSAVTILFGDDRDHHHGAATAAMGNPAEAVAWLLRSVAAENETLGVDVLTPILHPGDIVFTGGLTAPLDLRPGTTFEVTDDANVLSPATLST